MATAKKADIKIKNNNFTGDDGKLIYPRAHYDHLDGKPTSYPPTTHNHTVDEIEGLQDVLSRYSVWEDIEETLYVRTGDGIADLDAPYNTIPGSRIFATDIEAEAHEPSGSDKYALVTGFKWVSSNITEYNSTQGQWDITASFGRTPTVAEVNHLVLPTYDLYDHGQSNLVLKISDTTGGKSYWKLTRVDTTFQGNPKVYESVIANAARPTWNQVTNKPTFATVATSGSYNDLSNKPTIPSAYTLTKSKIDTALAGTASASIQLGVSATATGLNSTALGRGATATGLNSIAIGNSTTVTEDNVVDFGSARQVRVNEEPVNDRDAVSKKYFEENFVVLLKNLPNI